MAQYAPLTGADPLAAVHQQDAEMLSAAIDLDLVVFPGTYLVSDCDVADDFNEPLRVTAEPFDGLLVRALPEFSGPRIDPTPWQPKGTK